MSAENQELERAFLDALRKHFKKPGPWLPIQNMAAGSTWPDSKGIPKGQVWEIFIRLGTTNAILSLNDEPLNTQSIIGVWMPCQGVGGAYWAFTNIDPTTGDVTATAIIPAPKWVTLSEGWLLTDDETISVSAGTYKVRARRRFDLEQ